MCTHMAKEPIRRPNTSLVCRKDHRINSAHMTTNMMSQLEYALDVAYQQALFHLLARHGATAQAQQKEKQKCIKIYMAHFSTEQRHQFHRANSRCRRRSVHQASSFQPASKTARLLCNYVNCSSVRVRGAMWDAKACTEKHCSVKKHRPGASRRAVPASGKTPNQCTTWQKNKILQELDLS